MNKVDAVLAHYGILGMRWGKRKGSSSSTGSKGGSSKGKKTRTVKDMSNKEIQSRVKRIQLEQQYSSVSSKRKSKGRKMAESILSDSAKSVATTYVTKQMNDFVAKNTGKKKG